MKRFDNILTPDKWDGKAYQAGMTATYEPSGWFSMQRSLVMTSYLVKGEAIRQWGIAKQPNSSGLRFPERRRHVKNRPIAATSTAQNH